MPPLNVLVPSRGRPEAVDQMAEAFSATCGIETVLTFVVDHDDDWLCEYSMSVAKWHNNVALLVNPDPGSMVKALNYAARQLADHYRNLAFMGDDHRPRTLGWDQHYYNQLRPSKSLFVYGDDGFQGPNLPTQIAMRSTVVTALGYMALPTLKHLFVDNFWLTLGNAVNRIEYLPNVLIEHMHPAAGKADWDESYQRTNSGEMYSNDERAYLLWVAGQKEQDVAYLRELL